VRPTLPTLDLSNIGVECERLSPTSRQISRVGFLQALIPIKILVSAEGYLHYLEDKLAQLRHYGCDSTIRRLQEPILGGVDIGSLGEDQSRGYFCAFCGETGTLQEMVLLFKVTTIASAQRCCRVR
jgi:hypothetical protein